MNLFQVEILEPINAVTRRMSVCLAILLKQIDPDAEACKTGKKAKKSKTLPRGDYFEFLRLVSVSLT